MTDEEYAHMLRNMRKLARRQLRGGERPWASWAGSWQVFLDERRGGDRRRRPREGRDRRAG